MSGSTSDSGDAGGGGVGLGGAQDIGQFRDLVERGMVPTPDTFDAGGFFAEHFVEQPAPACGQPLCISPMLSYGRDWVTGQPRTTLQIALTTTIDASKLPRRPLDLVVVVDRSGSMSADARLSKVQSGLRLLVDQLGPSDRMALVSFESTATVDARLGSSRDALRVAIDRLVPSGGTNIHDGLLAGLSMASADASLAREHRVILLSDGLASAGITRDSSIVAMAEGFVKEGVGLSTIGVGTSFNPTLMRTLAERGAGNFYFLEDAQAIQEVFLDELKISMTPIALDLQIAAATEGGARIRRVTGRQGWSGIGAYGDVELPAAFAISRESSKPDGGRRGGGGALFLELENVGAPAEELARVWVSYRLPGQTERLQNLVEVGSLALPDGDAPVPAVSHQAMQKQAAMYELFRGIDASLRYYQQRDACASTVLSATRRSALLWNAEYQDPDIAADLILIEQLQGNIGQALGLPVSPRECNADMNVPEYPDPIDYDDDVYYENHGMACAAGGSAGGLAPLGLALLAVVRLRRRHGRVS